jgi:hypothetical protein
MKRRSMVSLSIVLLAVLVLGFQSTAFAASFKGSPTGKHVTTMAPNCVSAVGKSKVTPNCTPYPRCFATSCYNLDPYAEGCGTATTYNDISYVSAYIGNGVPQISRNSIPAVEPTIVAYLTNYYSPWCDANWAVVSLSPTGSNASIITDLQITTTDANKHKEEVCYPVQCNPMSFYTGGVYPSWTNMVDGTNTTYAYLYADGYDEFGGFESFLPYPLEADQ